MRSDLACTRPAKLDNESFPGRIAYGDPLVVVPPGDLPNMHAIGPHKFGKPDNLVSEIM
jgi:hypothetical protein